VKLPKTTLSDGSPLALPRLVTAKKLSVPKDLAHEWSEHDILRPALQRLVDAGHEALSNAGFVACDEATKDCTVWPALQQVYVRHWNQWKLDESIWPFVVAFKFGVDYGGPKSGAVALTTQLWDVFRDNEPRRGVLGDEMVEERLQLANAASFGDIEHWEEHVLKALERFDDTKLAEHVARILKHVNHVTTP
jgi:hypothetical protein